MGLLDKLQHTVSQLKKTPEERHIDNDDSIVFKGKKLSEKEQAKLLGRGFLFDITPRIGYKFYSDYFKIDDQYATILTFFNHQGSDDNLPPMWAIHLIPHIPNDERFEGVTTRLLTHVNRASEKWVESKQQRADDRVSNEMTDASESNRTKDSILSQKKKRDLRIIAEDLADGDSYLYVSFRLLVKAPSLEVLDAAIDYLRQQYDSTFGSIYLAAYEGRQRQELMNITRGGELQTGAGYMFTSSEFAGAYNLVTHGIYDTDGEYMGEMIADVNTSAILWNMNRFRSHVVVGTNNKAELRSQQFPHEKSSTLWGVKLSQSALLHNHRVVHFVLNGAKVQDVGIDLSDITSVVSMSKGDINPFEMFGSVEDELQIYPAHINKLVMMTQQLNRELTDIGVNTLRKQLDMFYIDKNMWTENAKEHRDRLRIVGIPHNQVPMLQDFVAYIDLAYKAYISNNQSDSNVLQSLSLLQGLFDTMLTANGDLFNTVTSDAVDNAKISPRVIYDLSALLSRGKGVAMAQFINAFGFATNSLDEGDVIIIHGAERIDPSILEYVRGVVDDLKSKNIRIAFLYDDVDKMLEPHNIELNNISMADWSITGYMSSPTIQKYTKTLNVTVPDNLQKAINSKHERQYYLRRGVDNVIFDIDFAL